MTENENAVQSRKPTISERTPEPEARKIMFDWRPVCGQCREPVENLEDASAVLFLGRGEWQLCHAGNCCAAAILGSWNGPRAGITPAAYLRRFA